MQVNYINKTKDYTGRDFWTHSKDKQIFFSENWLSQEYGSCSLKRTEYML